MPSASETNTSRGNITQRDTENHLGWADCTPCSQANEECKTSDSDTDICDRCFKIDPSRCYTDWEEHPGSIPDGIRKDVDRASTKDRK
ncbi:hypothetical protein V866_003702 [Kwoniella sp. B9012]|uniref:Zn(2)-C6 fungal-type domain-containing protein n=1 Tax=Kwoniella europaea PYCC6329 TaxID=1423913 RepID=A0AAX4KIJ0_9TREE